ncbi:MULTISPECIES: amidohydrolase family protein [unclassified Streptomyces]|uniref:amidohydrolase family protein n=1 Tax=unclassified Streptomyces TaxID=2593676 RepID=UPI003D8E1BB8
MTNAETDSTANENPLAGLKLIDSDTHYSEPYDLWTSRAPAKYKDVVPHVKRGHDGKLHWFLRDQEMFAAGGSSFVNRDGEKIPWFEKDFTTYESWGTLHEASYDPKARVKFMDEVGIYAQIIYPNTLGNSMAWLIAEEDKDMAYASVRIYNDAVAEFAATDKRRLFPVAVMPLWDIDLCVKEAERAKNELGLHSIAMAGEVHKAGLPDLGQPDWDPLYEALTDLGLPINIHIAAGVESAAVGAAANWTKTAWTSLPARAHKPVNSVQMELANSRFVSNLVLSDLAFRWPEVKWVSVESGIGWLPYVFERLDYEFLEDYPSAPPPDRPSAREMFQKNCYATFWFEDSGPQRLLDVIGINNVMWETDFPHPTCLHPDAVLRSAKALAGLGPDVLRRIVQDNAAELYNIDVS